MKLRNTLHRRHLWSGYLQVDRFPRRVQNEWLGSYLDCVRKFGWSELTDHLWKNPISRSVSECGEDPFSINLTIGIPVAGHESTIFLLTLLRVWPIYRINFPSQDSWIAGESHWGISTSVRRYIAYLAMVFGSGILASRCLVMATATGHHWSSFHGSIR